ncbi:radical SAM protein [Sporanaerobacter acetigenes]|uniref:radical SAM protein n=1 Tax=Sporanaerobacter acetigenes TaxID=165813 RepID=UPI00331F6594
MYPFVLKNSILHYFDDHGILLTNIGNYKLNDVEVYIIENFDGTKSIEEITNKIADELNTTDKIKVKNIIMEFICNKPNFIFLNKLPNPVYFKKTGVKHAKVPIDVTISLTNKCNLKCIHCFKNCSNKNDKFISYDMLIDTLKFLNNKSNNIQITGGEPMLHDNFFDILKYCIYNFKTTITTSGTLINSKNVHNFKGINNVQLSLYSYDKKLHDSITTVPGSFNKTVNAIKELSEIKIPSTIATIVTNSNINHMEDMINFAYQSGANSIRFGTLTPHGRATKLNSLILSQEEINNIEIRLDKLSKKYEKKIHVEVWTRDENYTNIDPKYKCLECGAGLLSWCISENGIIKPCEYLDDDVYPMLNITETKVEYLIKNCNFEKLPESLSNFEKILNQKNTSIKKMCNPIKNYYLQYCSEQ